MSNDDTISETEAYELGRKAFQKGASGDNNPFPEGDHRRDKWAHGFMDAQKILSDEHLPGRPSS
ncbi:MULTISPECIES: hypothetical protein [unclassified Rhizobium]|uniref:ribosome modulation factor n=1 Tax=unclassified Rhizobium TaxID=2613769 RepID=UPI000DDF3769|nr:MULTISPECIES: hypothetical protein [unclassified Rhizobium]MBB3285312.1 hypothetical protein [Rhizobium sp. BK252]MBB3400051.1 hypothetical protein [Rhizobium sp. BK289]MBB3412631.1 hypothetical protein [Rhizobium sp. BK284]MBB3480517.1 hypothetical protein [Rhizobium sp. BK347]MDK4719183.1 hypothetical protein [Rhizobium sp. CNPSo 3968]